ncbi:type II secretion system F family protein [Umezawaea sp. NPDC059074]|uniref:type II secretion system F family protein n=1 Tax=Umezawaea sp. NPDC059074 TaxID=3346716 RepID=UPI00369BD2A1
MTGVALCGAGLGVGLWMVAMWAFPPRPPLSAMVDRLTTVSETTRIVAPETGWPLAIGGPFVKPLQALGLPSSRLLDDLAVTGTAISRHLAEKATFALAGILLPVSVEFMLVLIDAGLAWQVPAASSVALGALGFVLPDLKVRRQAARRRAVFRHALSAYLNLIRVLLAGGAGVDGALSDAVGVGQGWAFSRIRQALLTAQVTRTTPWSTLGRLGGELGITQLAELAASLSLAGTEGARLRASLAAKATALRTLELTDAEGEAQSATERMSLPVVVLFGGFLVFIGFPALAQVLGGL